jgi:formylglycine-generating enzyme required for sulfatase activity
MPNVSRLPRTAVTLTGLALLVPALGHAQEATPDTRAPGKMVSFPATDSQAMGMDEAEIKSVLKAMGRDVKKWERFPYLWENGFLFFTPRHGRAVPAFQISRFEVTNAQWKVFLDDPVNVDEDVTGPGMTLKDIVFGVYDIDAEQNPVDAQRAGLYIYYRNEGRLMGALNPDADPNWEPLKAWVEETEIPAGTKIEYTRVLPPPYWKGGEIPEDELNKPVRYLSWNDARQFCRWAGLHLPLEAEWERAARGDEGRTFAWGANWDPKACVWKHLRGERETNAGPEPVDSFAEFTTPEGIHHMPGNVSEYVFDFAHRYPGSKSEFGYENVGCLARGGMWDDDDYVMLAADRIWDVGTTQIGAETRADGFGFRYAAYEQGGRDIALELATYSQEFFRTSGAAHWLPFPVGLTDKEREKREKREPLQGFSLDRTAGWTHRKMEPNAANHACVQGPAQGIAFVPIKGLLSSFLKDKGRFKKLSLDEKETALVGALVATDNCTIQLESPDPEGEPVTLDMGDRWSNLWTRHSMNFRYQVGAWLVMQDERIAVYAGDGSDAGVHGAHLRGKPLGYLPEKLEYSWAITAESPPIGGYTGGVATLSAPIPQLERDGTPKRSGKAIFLTIKVPATFE